MNENKTTGDDTISVKSKKRLSLKPGFGQGTVRQNFSQGRSKTVVVETRRKRRVVAPGTKAEAAKPLQPAPVKAGPQPAAAKAAKDEETRSSAQTLRGLTTGELDARAQALAEAKVREEEEAKRALIEAEQRAIEEARQAKLREEEEKNARLEADEVARKTEQAKREAEAPTAPAAPAQADAAASEPAPAKASKLDKQTRREDMAPERGRSKRGKGDHKPARRDTTRRRTRLTVTNALSGDDEKRGPSLAALRRRREREKRQASAQTAAGEKVVREVRIPDTITIQELSNRMAERAVDVIKILMKDGQMMQINDVIDADMAELIVNELGHIARRVSESDVEIGVVGEDDDEKDLEPRSPVIAVMGHVDHGKTSLLDSIRSENVASGEAGGITQHIGAYQVMHADQAITFLDTPGHEAFTAMRARGARSTDLVILVVAADDGVMPQTIEAINHARAAEVPIIVAINKIDKADADPSRVRTGLLQHEIVVESMGGDVLEVEISALEGTGIDALLEAIVLQTEILELKANPNRAAEGLVVEAKLDKGRGPVATVLVQRGTLAVGDVIVVGSQWGKVRALINDHGAQVREAGPSVPVEVLGLSGAPEAGDPFAVVGSEARAREITDYRQRLQREKAQARGLSGMSFEQMMTQLRTGEGVSEVPLIVKGDVHGSIEAITGALEKLETEEVAARVLHSGVGGITESDVTLAATTGTVIIGFNVRANAQAREAAERAGVEIRYYNIIYDLINDVKSTMSGLLAPERRETFLGNAEILEIFTVSKIGKVAGCRVTEGMVERGAGVRLIRDDVVIHEGSLSTLKRFKDEVNQVQAGQECGMGFANYQDLKAGDVIECYRVEEIERTL